MFIFIIRCGVISVMLILAHAFINEKSVKIFPKPHEVDVKDDALFGFSIAYHSGNSSLLIGAPQGNNLGKIYYMDLADGNLSDENPVFDETLKDLVQNNYDKWLGATVGVGPDFYVACSPRYVEMKNNSKAMVPAPLGVCFIKQKQLRFLRFIKDVDRKNNTVNSTDRMDSFGWSINVAPNERDVLIGGAAMFTGRVLFYKDAIKSSSVPKLINQRSADQPYKYNFGYSIASGNFFSDQTAYAISTTYGDIGFGKVYFYDTLLNHKDTITDDNLSSMFGAALCKAMLRGPALLVGAPSYAENDYTHDVGVVYIYAAQSDESNRMKRQRTIKGTKSGGFFGFSIVSLGDMDGDGNDEIVIAAPYEDDGKGAIYIYSGVGIFDGRYYKRIQPEKLKTFGYSLAVVPSDTESNGLAIGAIGSNSIVVYKGIPSITVKLHSTMENLKMKNQTELEIKSCIDIEYPKKPVKFKADIQILIKVTDQICTLHEDNALPLKVTEKTSTRLCRKNVRASCPADVDSKFVISYELTAMLLEENNMDYDPLGVLLSERSRLFKRADETWPCEETDEKPCKPELKVEINSSIAQPYIVGSSTYETVSLDVLNSGAMAYGPCVEIQVLGAEVSRLPSECTIRAGTDTILCKHKRHIQKGKYWVMGNLILQPRTEITIMKEFYMTVKCIAYYDCNKPNDNRTFEKKYILKGDIDNVNIKGQTNPEGDVDVTPFVLRTEGKSFEHLYIIENKGSTSWNGMQVQITLEYTSYLRYPDVPIKIYQDSSYKVCPIDDEPQINSTIKVLCNIGDLLKLSETTVIISMEILPNTLELDEKEPNIIVTTTINVMGMNKSLSEQSLVKLQLASVPAWVIATASIISLVLLSIIAYALYEFGFYKRETKKKLVALKADVYRQSIRRSMIRESMRAAARRKSTEDIPFLPEADDDRPVTENTFDEKLRCQKSTQLQTNSNIYL